VDLHSTCRLLTLRLHLVISPDPHETPENFVPLVSDNYCARIRRLNVWNGESATALKAAQNGRAEATRRLALKQVPTITILGLTADEMRAIVIADNRYRSRLLIRYRLTMNNGRRGCEQQRNNPSVVEPTSCP
jgi:hypothetical protein